MSRPSIVVVAGHDSSGNAGIDADRDAARAFPIDATYLVTAWTEQDERGVRAVRPRGASAWRRELDEAFARPDAASPRAVKVGLLPTVDDVHELARWVEAHDVPVVVDPVARASSGGDLVAPGVGAAIVRELLLPRVVLTPNLPEARALLEVAGRSSRERGIGLDAAADLARALIELGVGTAVVKGGHASGEVLADFVATRDGGVMRLERARIPGAGIRGSGCRFATALAAGLALGDDVERAARRAGELVAERIRGAERGEKNR